MKKLFSLLIFVSLILSSLASAFLFESGPYDDVVDEIEQKGSANFGSKSNDLAPSPQFTSEFLSSLVTRDMSKYSSNNIFISSSSDWKSTLKASTLASWNSVNDESCTFGTNSDASCSYPFFVVFENDFFSINNFISKSDYSSATYLMPDSSSSLSGADFSIDSVSYSNYYSYFSSVSAIVAVYLQGDVVTDYSTSIHASIIASKMGLPLVFVDKDDLKYLDSTFNTKQISHVVLVSSNGGGSFDPLVKKYFKDANIKEVSVSLPETSKKVLNYFTLQKSSLDPLIHKKVVVFNPSDILDSSCIPLETTDESLSGVSNIMCKDSLLTSYLATYHNQDVISIKNTASYISGLNLNPNSKVSNEDLFDKSISNVNAQVKSFKDDEPYLYVTFIGSPLVIPYSSNDKYSSDLLMADSSSSHYGFLPRGRVMGLTTSDTSSLLMSNFFLPIKKDSFVAGFDSPNLIGQKYLPIATNNFKQVYDSVSFYNDDFYGKMFIDKETYLEKSSFVSSFASSDVLFLETNSFVDSDFSNSLSTVYSFESNPVLFLVGDDSLTINSTFFNSLLMVRKGARGVYGFIDNKNPSAQMKFFPSVFYSSFKDGVLTGDFSSLLQRIFLDYHWTDLSYDSGNVVSLKTKDESLPFSTLEFIGTPLSPLLDQTNKYLFVDKVDPKESLMIPLDKYSTYDISYAPYYLVGNTLDESVFNRWKINALSDEDDFVFESIIFPNAKFEGGISYVGSQELYSFPASYAPSDLKSFKKLNSISFDDYSYSSYYDGGCGLVSQLYDVGSFPLSLFYSSPYIDITNPITCDNQESISSDDLFDDSIWMDLIRTSDLKFSRDTIDDSAFVSNSFLSRFYNPKNYPIDSSDDNMFVYFVFKSEVPAFEGNLIFCLYNENLFSPDIISKGKPISIDNPLIKVVPGPTGSMTITVGASFIEDVSTNSYSPSFDDLDLSNKRVLTLESIDPLSLNSYSNYFDYDFVSYSSPACFKADLSSFDSINRDSDVLIKELGQELFTKQYAFEISVAVNGLGSSVTAFSPVFITNILGQNSDVTKESSTQVSDPVIIPKTSTPVHFLSLKDESLPLDYDYTVNRMYRLSDKSGLVVYVGDGVFFDYYLSTAYELSDDGNIYQGLTKPEYQSLLSSYRSSFSSNHNNPLNDALVNEVYLWGVEKANDPQVKSTGQAKGFFVYTDDGKESVSDYFEGCALEAYDCIGLAQGAYEFIFSGLEGCGSANYKSFYSCYSGYKLFTALEPLGFSADVHSLNYVSFNVAKSGAFSEGVTNTFERLDNPDVDTSILFPNLAEPFDGSIIPHLKQIMDLKEYVNFYVHGTNDVCSSFLSYYPKGSIIEEFNETGGEQHVFLKGNYYDTIEAHISSTKQDVTMGTSNGDGVECTGNSLYIYPTGFDPVLASSDSYSRNGLLSLN